MYQDDSIEDKIPDTKPYIQGYSQSERFAPPVEKYTPAQQVIDQFPANRPTKIPYVGLIILSAVSLGLAILEFTKDQTGGAVSFGAFSLLTGIGGLAGLLSK